jgi:hypothetical protein
MTPAFFGFSNVVAVSFAALVAFRASRSPPHGGWIVLLMGVQWVLFLNGLFHVGATLRFGEYSPGVVTSLVLYFPLTLYLARRLVREQQLTRGQLFKSLPLCILWMGGIVASLGWRKPF